MSQMMKILEDLTPLNRVMCSSDYDRTIEYLLGVLPFKVLEYPSKIEHNGWIIPPKWDVKEATILRDGKVIYDGTKHPLRLIALSKSFEGTVDLAELKKHLHYDGRYDDVVPFHFRQQFRSWDRDWGFCVSKAFFDNLASGEYEVIIETEEAEGYLKVLEYTHIGDLEESIAFGGNLDHPGVANDGLAGCVVGIEVLGRLRGRKTKYTYKLVLAPGILGSELYLGRMQKNERDKIREGVFLEMLGSETQLALQASRDGESNIEYCLAKALDDMKAYYRKGAFESIIINDEYIWEGYGIPMASLSRFPYPEYHCDKDNVSIMSERSLDEAVEAIMKAIELVESSPLIIKKFEGNICLSNPKYELYVDPGQAQFEGFHSEDLRRMRHLMDLIPGLNCPRTIRWVAEQVGLSEEVTLDYLRKWQHKGLIELR